MQMLPKVVVRAETGHGCLWFLQSNTGILSEWFMQIDNIMNTADNANKSDFRLSLAKIAVLRDVCPAEPPPDEKILELRKKYAAKTV